MISTVYVTSARAAFLAWTFLLLSACSAMGTAAPTADPLASSPRAAKLEAAVEQAQAVAQAAAAATENVPGLGKVSTVAGLISLAMAAALSAWRNQTRKTDPVVANTANGSNGGGAP